MNSQLISSLLETLDKLSGGVHPGFRPVHAKGVMCSGSFQPSPDAAKLTRAPHALRHSTMITVRFSLAAGVPTVADNDPAGASPQGVAVIQVFATVFGPTPRKIANLLRIGFDKIADENYCLPP
jgi:catalase